MNAVFKLSDSDQLQAEITLRGTVGEFRQLHAILEEGKSWRWPLSAVRDALVIVINASTAHFTANVEKEAK